MIFNRVSAIPLPPDGGRGQGMGADNIPLPLDGGRGESHRQLIVARVLRAV